MSTPAKKTKGRQKIEMKKILDEKSLAVTFSKRQSGIFKKFKELSILCAVQFATIIFSPTKKPFSCGIPTLEAVINRYLEQPPPNPSISQHMEPYQDANIQELQELNSQLTDMTAQVKAVKKTGVELEIMKKAMQDRNWRNAPIETLEVDQLEEVKMILLELKNNAEMEAKRLSMVEAATTSVPTIPSIPSFGSTGATDGAGPSK